MLRAHVMPPCRQGAYSGYRPQRFDHRVYPTYGCTVESNTGWYRGIVLRDNHVIERLKAVRDRATALGMAQAAMAAHRNDG